MPPTPCHVPVTRTGTEQTDIVQKANTVLVCSQASARAVQVVGWTVKETPARITRPSIGALHTGSTDPSGTIRGDRLLITGLKARMPQRPVVNVVVGIMVAAVVAPSRLLCPVCAHWGCWFNRAGCG